MPQLKLISLSDVLSDDDLVEFNAKLSEIGVTLPEEDETFEDIEDQLTDDQLTDFVDKLDAHDIACDTYLPAEFEGQITAGDRTIGSTHVLIEVLEDLREELDIDDEIDPDNEDEFNLSAIEEQLNYAWSVFYRGANASIGRSLPLLVID